MSDTSHTIDTSAGPASSDDFWGRVRGALGALRPTHRGEREPAYGQAAIARSLGMRQRLGSAIEDELTLAWTHCAERKVSLSLMVIEMDRFTEHFAAYGRGETDDCIKSIRQVIDDALPREGDRCLRLGRSSLVLVLPDFPGLMARATASKLAGAVRDKGFAHKDSHAGVVTVSVGLAVVNPQGALERNFFETAAAALKKAQRRGICRVEAIDLRPAQEQKRKAR